MANRNPDRARRAKALKRLASVKTADLNDARAALSLALCELVERIGADLSIDELCKLTGALTRTTGELRMIVEGVEFDARLTELEQRQQSSSFVRARA